MVCVGPPKFQGTSVTLKDLKNAGGPRAIGWLGPTKTHPMSRVNVPAEKVGMGTFGCSLWPGFVFSLKDFQCLQKYVDM